MSSKEDPAPPLLVARRGHVTILTINRPGSLNAINAEVADLLGAAVEEATADDDVWAVVLSGAGGRAFCAGADLKAMSRNETIVAAGHEEWGFAGFVRHFTPKPVIAAVEGYALGGGLEICLACDLIIASSSARFGLPEVRRGIIPGGGGLIRLPRQIPYRRAIELIFTGDDIDADEALRLGLVNTVVTPGTALEHALALADKLGESAPLALQAAKRVALLEGANADADEHGWERSGSERLAIAASEDAKEGIAAFSEKRRPKWLGR